MQAVATAVIGLLTMFAVAVAVGWYVERSSDAAWAEFMSRRGTPPPGCIVDGAPPAYIAS
jgi:hypothetical protein